MAQQSAGEILYTAAGRAYSLQSPFLGATASASYLALTFSDVVRRFDSNLADIYLCWARTQVKTLSCLSQQIWSHQFQFSLGS